MRRVPFHLLLVPLLAALVVGLGLLSPFDLRAYDELMRLQQRTPPSELVLLRIDDEALRRYPDFVDRRPLALARLLNRLNQAKPRVVGLHLRLDPRDPRDGVGLEQWREAMALHGRVVGRAALVGRHGRSAERDVVDLQRSGVQAIGLELPHDDADRVLRGSLAAAPLGGALRPGFPLALLLEAGDRVPEARRFALAEAIEAADGDSAPLRPVFYGPAGTITTISAADVLDGGVHPEAWQDRVVVIGGGEPGTATPVAAWAGTDLASDEVAAQSAAALLDGRLMHWLPDSGNALLVGAALLVFAIGVGRVRQRRVVPVAVAGIAVVLVAWSLAWWAGWWVPPVALVLGLGVQLGIELGRRYSRAASQLAAELAVLRREAAPLAAPPPGNDFEQGFVAVREAIGSIRQQREYVHRLVDVQPAAVVVVDAQQRVRLCNAQALAWRTDSAAPTGTLREWLAAVDLVLPSEPGHYVGSGSARLLARCGERDVIVAFEPLPAAREDSPHDTLVCATEVSSLVADQRERQVAIDFLSHDLRAPAHSLIELCEAAQQDPTLAPATRQQLQAAERLSRRLVQMATTYLDFVRSASPEAFMRNEPVLLADVALEAAETAGPEAQAKGQRLDLGLDDGEEAWITGDGALLRRAVENLLSNAVRFTPTGGRIELRIERRGGSVAVVVRDQGPGIAPARRSQLFQRFGPLARPAKGGGRSMGLGLAMVMSVVARHRGSVLVDDAPGGGTEFRLELPLERFDVAAG